MPTRLDWQYEMSFGVLFACALTQVDCRLSTRSIRSIDTTWCRSSMRKRSIPPNLHDTHISTCVMQDASGTDPSQVVWVR
ncbi:hypothetical protein F5Y12DRAFT_759934 [Xylaria sp. FL1777]|nr:hypothetical protein F5Y12DRAFT_759934 [Xylaria sp. FL1777]